MPEGPIAKEIDSEIVLAGDDSDSVPLVVDLDGSLLATDILWESVLSLVRTRPQSVFSMAWWLLRGRAHFKCQVSQRVSVDISELPYNADVVDFVRSQRLRGRTIIMATAANERAAHAAADHLGVFSVVLASDGRTNLKGEAKLSAVYEHLGDGAVFDYVGNGRSDLPLFRAARRVHHVRSSKLLQDRIRQTGSLEVALDGTKGGIRDYLRALRVHQWVKNLLLFVPIGLAHRFADMSALLDVGVAYFAFSLCSSAVYVTNDLLDLPSDRAHPRKKSRPFASGSIQIVTGFWLAPALLLTSFGISSALLSDQFVTWLAVYLIATTAYSVRLKRVVLVDVLVLAGLYSIRLFAGGAAAAVPISQWLIAFSVFFFLSLALVKRYSEIQLLDIQEGRTVSGRGYHTRDGHMIRSLGTAAGYISILVIALYVSSDEVVGLYGQPHLLWLTAPPILYWVSRVWLLADRGYVEGDPVVFAVRDPASYVVGLMVVGVLVLAAG